MSSDPVTILSGKDALKMSSPSKRLDQINQHVQSDQPSQTAPPVDILCTTREYKPGHNVATITFSNPTKLNVASGFLLDKLIETCTELGRDEKLRAVVLTGAPPPAPGKPASFIGGADVQELARISSSDEARTYIERVHNACAAVGNLPVPVIARVHGFALGAGLELMACCDLKVASKTSKFGMPEVKIGLPCVVEAALFPGQIGVGRTRRLVYLAENISADMAQEWGLIEHVAKDEADLDRAVDDWTDKIVGMGPQNMRLQKRLMRKWENSSLQEGIAAGVDAIAETYADGGQEAKEYMRPFLTGKGQK